ncbi:MULTISPECIES: minor coat protein [Enterobacteriaceae]|uniref:minor coat protein n=1 Tax=Enterobacteriaceae TaxID=543 RepID=UPI000367D81B|nr:MULTISPECIES: minor coat protein [Enterobacteriaceae]EBB2609696.1 phage coat protein [Salmonella enterica]EBS3634763.1 phage coat protein [Salmonella enterica subsp. enterica serovar Apapa]AZZ16352.1 phage coat protein [Klebsiella sp. LY]AZZ16360.1 phage coat protein [Klebsiella sp. LY]AZZ16666.1 phage coat protein [Klebsiella sp. LY]
MPAFLGLPLLARFIGWLAGVLIGYFARFLTLGIARIALAITLFLALIVGLNQLLVSYLSDLVAALPADISDAIAYIIPSNALPCLYAIFSLKAAIFIFDVKDRIIGYLDWNKS